MERCPAWRAGVQFFREGYYWEAHEVWEAVWMAAPENGPEKIMVQAAIQLANARLKQALDRPRAAIRLQRMASGLMQEAWNRGGGSVMGMVRPLSGSGVQYSAERALLRGRN
nr:DUF309 domain-containing protein [Sagittula salina]